MKTKEITIAGKQVSLAYCYATEIGFTDIADTGIENIDTANPKHILALIMSAILAYYEGKKQDCPIESNALMYESDPSEITAAFISVLELRNQWYKLSATDTEASASESASTASDSAPVSDASPSESEEQEKNA
jgi:hypothetical protein